MLSINKAIIYGNITKDVELKSLPSGMTVASLSIATNKKTKDKKDIVEFHNIVAFGKQAELINQYCKKGDGLYVEGRIQTRSWDGQDGKKQYRTEIIVENMQFGFKKNNGTTYDRKDSQETSSNADEVQYPDEDIDPMDIPF